jgi:hypothetical protein
VPALERRLGMLTWIVTSACIGTFSAAALELFRECDDSSPCVEDQTAGRWQHFTDADLDALVGQFSCTSEEARETGRSLAA